MTILNLNNDLYFELPFQDGSFDEYIRTIDISVNEKETILSLMNKEFKVEVEDLGLEKSNPELFAKLKDIYDRMASEAEEKQWLWIGFRDGAFTYDIDKLMGHCQENCGFIFDSTKEDFEDEDEYCDAKMEAFDEWLEDYLITLDDNEFKAFMYNHLNANIELDEQNFAMKRLIWDAKPLTEDQRQVIETKYFEFIAEIKSHGCPQDVLAELVGRSVYDYICEYEHIYDEWELIITSEFEDFYNTYGPSSLNYKPDQEKLKSAIYQD